MGRPLLVPYQDMAQLGILRQGILQRQDNPAGVAKDDLNSLFNQTLTQNLGTS